MAMAMRPLDTNWLLFHELFRFRLAGGDDVDLTDTDRLRPLAFRAVSMVELISSNGKSPQAASSCVDTVIHN